MFLSSRYADPYFQFFHLFLETGLVLFSEFFPAELRCCQEYPAVEVFSYQCSPLSTSQGIEQTFHHAVRYQSNASNTIVVVLMDEVGLAEQSAHLPLKVLHKLLEKPEVAVVGISNWTLGT
jgi:hypothetical protein